MTTTTTATTPIAIESDGRTLTVRFERFDLDAYALFLRAKRLPESELVYDWETDVYTLTAPVRFAHYLDVSAAVAEREWLPLAGHLFDFQQFCVRRALEAKRFALWADTGLGKGLMILEWCRQVVHVTEGKVLILEPLAVIPQLFDEAEKFYGSELQMTRLDTREAVVQWCQSEGSEIGITNPQKFIEDVMPELRYLAGVAYDESSGLKSGGGVIKWNLIKSCRGIEYKLSATATPAPNDAMEYASQAAWLEKLRNEGDILWTYFHKTKAGDWEVKPHARAAFYQFMSSWSVYLRNPAHFGFADILATLPAPEIREYPIEMTDAQQSMAMTFRTVAGKGMFDDRLGVSERSKLSQLAKGFLYGAGGTVRYPSLKPAVVADLVRGDVADGLQVLVWTVFDEESAILQRELFDLGERLEVLDGSMSEAARLDVLHRFRRGDVRVLISKAQLIGYGMNLQFCRSMVFSGFDDSFERMYQATRRALRFGQTEVVRIHVPYVPELEGMIFSNVKNKEAAFLRDVAIQEEMYRRAMEGELE